MDEVIHGAYVGMLAQELYQSFSQDNKDYVDSEVIKLLEVLMENEIEYTDDIYSPIFLDTEVKTFLKYNANKALMNLGREPFYQHDEVNSIVLNGLDTGTKTHDFFSQKGNGYQKGKVEPLRDEDFIFDF